WKYKCWHFSSCGDVRTACIWPWAFYRRYISGFQYIWPSWSVGVLGKFERGDSLQNVACPLGGNANCFFAIGEFLVFGHRKRCDFVYGNRLGSMECFEP